MVCLIAVRLKFMKTHCIIINPPLRIKLFNNGAAHAEASCIAIIICVDVYAADDVPIMRVKRPHCER